MNIEHAADATDKVNHSDTPLLRLFKTYHAKDRQFLSADYGQLSLTNRFRISFVTGAFCGLISNRNSTPFSFMGVCVLVTSGENFDVDEYLRESPFKPQQIYRKGEIPSKDNPERQPLTESGFILLVSQDEYPQLIEQVVHALRYWEEELQWLTDAGADKMLLDFGITEQAMLQRPQYLPAELISAMSRFEMGLVFSVIRGESH